MVAPSLPTQRQEKTEPFACNNQQVECNKVDGCYIGGQTSGVDVYERKNRGENGEEGQDVAIDTGLDIGDFFLFVLDLFKFSGIDVGII